ncbi:furin-1-like isoform X3 [Sinocyclocheilus rhinocerous]|uniref:furin-1-like isoform X3 n=1 Tax=Sinocyclocheilus rhinocerous TaxID=307959 RepID=UPI0007BA685D|nr:PREDICTED: furin-1-like isoform X3 [Sinocyclocheilus rhinocerous]
MEGRWTLLLFLGAYLVLLAAETRLITGQGIYTNTWAVHIEGGAEEAEKIAHKHGFISHGQVIWAEQQIAKRRHKRDIHIEPTDPKFPQQWYLYNPSHGDLNVKEAWAQGFTGRGVVVTILDDGIEKDHPDLARNYDPDASYDVNDRDPDPQPRYTQLNDNRHGTRCAGEVAAAANNGVCGVGVAYNAKIGGVRMLDGEVTDVVEAQSLSLNSQHIHIYSASWGPEDDGKTVDGPAKLAKEAFLQGVTEGRGGLGSIFVWASGNGGRERDSCNCDGYTNSIYTLSISSTTQYGNVPWYSEACSSTLATTYSSGNLNEKQIVTTDLRKKCTDSHTGTSASAPLAAGIIALALEANMNLTWRDMLHLVVRTSHPAHLITNDWRTNGVGRLVSHSYGYGLLDASAMVALARNWSSVGLQHKCVINMLTEPRDIRNHLVFSRSVEACSGQLDFVSSLEHVQAKLTFSYNHRGNLAVHLISPLGTRSTLLAPRPQDNSAEGFNDWAFMTTHSWDEDPRGEWTLEIENVAGLNDYGVLSQFTLILYGTGSSATDPSISDYTRPSNNSCKTFDTQQICIECSTGFSLFLQGCVKSCPPGFSSGLQVLNLSLDSWVEHSTVQACLSCHPACLTCFGSGENECLFCPPHSHLVVTSCLQQNQRKWPSIPVLQHEVDPNSDKSLHDPGLSSRLPALVAVLSCAFILATFAAVFVLLQLHSGAASAPFCRRTKLPVMETGGGGIRVGFGFGLGRGKVSYRGIPTVWGDEDAAGGMNSESDSEELEYHSEKTAFIRTQSAL